MGEKSTALLDRVILIAGGLEMAVGALMAALPNLVPQWLAWGCFGVGAATVIFGVVRIRHDIWDWLLEKAKERDARTNLTPLDGVSEYVPDLRVADEPSVIALFEGRARDKLFPLLEIEKIASWGRPKGPGDLPLTKISGLVWKTHQLFHWPKSGEGTQNQTYLKTKTRQDTTYYDVHLNRTQIGRIWPDSLNSAEKNENQFSQLTFRTEHPSDKHDFKTFVVIAGQDRRTGVAVLGRYARSVHTVVGVHWEWRPTRVIRPTCDMHATEVWEHLIFTRPASGENVLRIFDESIPLDGDRLVLLVVRVVAGHEIVRGRIAYHVRNLNGARLTLPIKLEDIPYVTGTDDD
jgi:hypothetical protein